MYSYLTLSNIGLFSPHLRSAISRGAYIYASGRIFIHVSYKPVISQLKAEKLLIYTESAVYSEHRGHRHSNDGHTHIMLWGRGHKGGNHKNIWKIRHENYLPLKVISFIFHIFLLLNYWIMSFILKYLTTHGYYYRYVLKIIVIFTFYLFSPLLIKWGFAGCSFFVLFTAFLGIFQPCSFFMSQKSLYTLFVVLV